MVSIRIMGCSAMLLIAFNGIFAVPIQLHEDAVELSNGVYPPPELAEALSRSYAALEWAQKNVEPTNVQQLRNLDQIGGGNLLRSLQQLQNQRQLRNLDSIGGGNLVRSLARPEFQRYNQV